MNICGKLVKIARKEPRDFRIPFVIIVIKRSVASFQLMFTDSVLFLTFHVQRSEGYGTWSVCSSLCAAITRNI